MSKKQIIAIVVTMSLSFSIGLSVLAFLIANHYGTYYYQEPAEQNDKKDETANKENEIKTDIKAENKVENENNAVKENKEDLEAKKTEKADETVNELNTKANIYSRQAESKEKTLEEIAQLKSNVVVVSSGNSQGSGVIISPEGYIVTNNHVVKGGNNCTIAFEDPGSIDGVGEGIAAAVIKADPERDIALLKINKSVKGVIPLGDSSRLKVGERIVTIGNPNGLINTVADGIVSSIRKLENVTLVQITSPITYGSSGGALLNLKGELVGITTAGFEGGGNLNFAVSSKDIKNFLAEIPMVDKESGN